MTLVAKSRVVGSRLVVGKATLGRRFAEPAIGTLRILGAVLLSSLLVIGLSPSGALGWVEISTDPSEVDQADTVAGAGGPDAQDAPHLDELPSLWRASEMAIAMGERIEVVSERSETRQVWATPDGRFEARIHLSPERFERDGEWVDVDLELVQRSDGSVAPQAHPYGLVLSGEQTADSDHDLVSISDGDHQIALGWRGRLPEPTLDGTTATWHEVRPGVDLVVEVAPAGFRQYLVVHDRRGLAQVSMIVHPWRVDGYELENADDGGLLLKRSGGESQAHVPGAWMWDSRVDEVSGEHLNRAPVGLEVRHTPGGQELVVTPDPAFLADANLEFPVTIDPTVELGPSFDAFVETGVTSDQSGSTELKLGTFNGGTTKARSFMSFHHMTYLHGATVHSASLYLWNHWSYSCRSARWDVWRTSYVTTTARWTNQPTWAERVGTSTSTRGYNSSCAGGWVSIDVKGAFDYITNDGASSTVNLGLRARNESDSDSWKRFRSSKASSARPYVILNYTANRPPAKPTNVKVYEHCDGSCTSGTIVRARGAGIQAQISDPESHRITAYFEARQGTTVVYESSVTIESGEIALRRPWLDAGQTYRFRVRGKDRWGLYGSWSDYFYFTIDTSGPSAPANVGVASTGDCYPAESCNSPAILNNSRPTFGATPQHPFNDRTDVVFEIHPSSQTSVIQTGTLSSRAAGNPQTWTVPSALPQGQLRLRVRSVNDDYGRSGPWSSWFHFTIDTTPPNSPTVSSDFYPHKDTLTWNGGVGVSGSFTFGPNGSNDVTRYEWRWNGGASISGVNVSKGSSTSRQLAPPGDLLQVLEVRTIDHAGWVSGWRSYPFWVRPQPVDRAYWKFDELSGLEALTTVGGSAYVGQLHGGATFVPSLISDLFPEASGNAVSLDGSSGFVQMPTVLETDHTAGFTMSAWVKAASLTGTHTVIGQSGANTYMARIVYLQSANDGLGGWCLQVRHSDSTGAPVAQVCSPADQVKPGEWQFLAAVFDRPAGVLRLYVDGGFNNGEWPPGWEGEVAAPTAWASVGAFRVGRSASGSYWNGLIDEVRAYQRVVGEAELVDYFLSCRYGACEPML
jgi:hypothetical protein